MKAWIQELCPEIAEWQAQIIAEEVDNMVSREREACALACESRFGTVSQFATSVDCESHNDTVNDCAEAIRAMSKKP